MLVSDPRPVPHQFGIRAWRIRIIFFSSQIFVSVFSSPAPSLPSVHPDPPLPAPSVAPPTRNPCHSTIAQSPALHPIPHHSPSSLLISIYPLKARSHDLINITPFSFPSTSSASTSALLPLASKHRESSSSATGGGPGGGGRRPLFQGMDFLGLKKRGQGLRSWIRVDAAMGNSQLIEVDKFTMMWRCDLPARDLRLLDPLFVYPSTILDRDKAIVVNLEKIRCIITADEVFLLNSIDSYILQYAAKLQRCLVTRLQPNEDLYPPTPSDCPSASRQILSGKGNGSEIRFPNHQLPLLIRPLSGFTRTTTRFSTIANLAHRNLHRTAISTQRHRRPPPSSQVSSPASHPKSLPLLRIFDP